MPKENIRKAKVPAKAEKPKLSSVRAEIVEIICNSTKISRETIEKYSKEPFSQSGLDSFALVEIIYAIENRFAIDIPQDSLITVKNLEDLVVLVMRLNQKNG